MAITMVWNDVTKKFYETGVDRPVLYVRNAAGAYPAGVPWEGFKGVTEKPGGAEPTDLWANNEKYAQLISAETFAGTIEAYTFPDEFMACDGAIEEAAGFSLGQQPRAVFGLCYRTWFGSDVAGSQAYYKLHIIYGCRATPSEVARASINEGAEAVDFSWEFETTPVSVTGYNSVSKITISSKDILPADLAAIESQLYGDDVGPITANLPLPDALIALLTP